MTLDIWTAAADKAAARRAGPAPGPGAVIAWLRSPEGEEWSRSRSEAPPEDIVIMRPWWRARGPLKRRYDPCGAPPARRPKHRRTT